MCQQRIRYVAIDMTKENEKSRNKYKNNEEYREYKKKKALERYYRIKAEKEAEKQLENNI